MIDEVPDGTPVVRAVPAGLAVVGVALLENLSANRALLTYLSLALAGFYLVVRHRSLARAVLALVPALLAIGLSSLIVGGLGITLSPLTTVSGPLVVAACSEFAVLILARYLEERGRGLSPQEASDMHRPGPVGRFSRRPRRRSAVSPHSSSHRCRCCATSVWSSP